MADQGRLPFHEHDLHRPLAVCREPIPFRFAHPAQPPLLIPNPHNRSERSRPVRLQSPREAAPIHRPRVQQARVLGRQGNAQLQSPQPGSRRCLNPAVEPDEAIVLHHRRQVRAQPCSRPLRPQVHPCGLLLRHDRGIRLPVNRPAPGFRNQFHWAAQQGHASTLGSGQDGALAESVVPPPDRYHLLLAIDRKAAGRVGWQHDVLRSRSARQPVRRCHIRNRRFG